MKKIVFISHEASLSGAPLVLLNFLRWLKKNNVNIERYLLILSGGPKLEEFNSLAKKLWNINNYNETKNGWNIIKNALLNKLGVKRTPKVHKLYNEISTVNPDIIYCNTIASLYQGLNLKKKNHQAKLVLHLHELPTVIDLLCPDFQTQSQDIDSIIVVSELVKSSVINRYGIAPAKILLVYEFIDNISAQKTDKTEKNNFIIGGAGLVTWRKGYDLFILVAYQFKKLYPDIPIKFRWVGKIPKQEKIIVNEDIRKSGISNIVEFMGELEQPYQAYSQFDLFLLASREDPFPLVCLEMAHLGIPFICFDKGTGSTELISTGGGKIVPYLDINAIVQSIHDYYLNSSQLEKDGKALMKKASHYYTENQAKYLSDYLLSL